jgi:hypothetical protein
VIAEGATVSYVGHQRDDLAIGDRGRVLSDAGSGSYVMWSTGKLVGQITLEPDMDLVASNGARIVYNDSFDTGLVTIAVRDTYDTAGPAGLLNALNDEGHLASFPQIAEEAVRHVASRIREDPSIAEVLANLDPEEGADFVGLAATALLRDAFGPEDSE